MDSKRLRLCGAIFSASFFLVRYFCDSDVWMKWQKQRHFNHILPWSLWQCFHITQNTCTHSLFTKFHSHYLSWVSALCDLPMVTTGNSMCKSHHFEVKTLILNSICLLFYWQISLNAVKMYIDAIVWNWHANLSDITYSNDYIWDECFYVLCMACPTPFQGRSK